MSVRIRSVAVRRVAWLCLLSAAFAATAARSQGASSLLDSRATAVAAGTNHGCALSTGGGVQCWGGNGFGQLGNGSTVDSALPVAVANLSGGVAAIAAGDSFSCALTMTGGVQCWGLNQNGQLGNGSTSGSSTPVAVANLSSGVAAITVGEAHACALTTSGGVQCWGLNGNGQLGNGSTADSSTPVAVANLSDKIVAVVAGGYHTCALTSTGSVQCWGQNSQGQLGSGSTTDSSSPVTVANLAGGVTAIAAGYRHTCALPAAGGVQCWGYNVYGQLGNGSNSTSLLPGPVANLGGEFAKIAAGKYQTCVLDSAGGLQCWGWNTSGQLGNGTTANFSTPTAATALPGGAAAAAMGSSQSCVLTSVGGVLCFGANGNGQLGNGTTASSLTPVAVAGFSSAVAVATRSVVINAGNVAEPGGTFVSGYGHTCAVTNAGGVQCWGQNDHGQLGNGSTTNSSAPVPVTGLAAGVTAVAAGSDSLHTCALTTSGGVQCWGLNNQGELGNGSTSDSSVPVAVTNLASGVAALATGNDHTCALTSAGGVQCWGSNITGQLGNGSTTNSSLPIGVAGLDSGVVAIAAGLRYSCALLASGGVKCWGWNLDGQLGNGSTANSTTPVVVSGLAGTAVAIAAGTYHACVLLASGAVQCWGLNSFGELGNGAITSTAVSTPVTVTNLGGSVVAIAAGGYHTCALTAAGAVQCWGRNSSGQLGNNSTTTSSVPVTTLNLASGVTALSAGDGNSCALTGGGGLQCWGSGYFGAKTPLNVLAGLSLSFAPPSTLAAAGGLTLHASASNGSSATFDSWTTDTCTVTDMYAGTLVALKPGLCGVRATRTGYTDTSSNWWAAAPQQLRLIQITTASPTLTLATSGSPSAVGASVTFTATLNNALNPSAPIVFCADAALTNASCSGGTLLCSVASAGAPITCAASALAAGSHAISAYFAGDANNNAAVTASALVQVVGSAPVITSANTAAWTIGQSGGFTVTATGTPVPSLALAAGDTLPSGVQFVDHGDGTAALSGVAAAGTVGTYTLHVSARNGISPDAAQTLTLTVSKASSALALVASPASILLGQSTTLSATVSSANAQATGTVAFTDGGVALPGCAAVVLASGLQAQCAVVSFSAGAHSITAAYSGDASTTGSNGSPPTVVTVQAPGASIALNDSGQTLCDNGAASDPVLVACTTAIVGDSGTYPRQDARFGRDAAAAAGALAKTGGGTSGFDFTKICQNGTANCAGNANMSGYAGLAATNWVCTRDNVTGLVWALYVNNNGYWFEAADSSSTTNDAALANANALCGYGSGWRLPTRRELLSIVDYGATGGVLIDTNYFPGTGNFYFWSGDTYLPPPQLTSGGPFAWAVDFNLGAATFAGVRSGARVRVVHGSP